MQKMVYRGFLKGGRACNHINMLSEKILMVKNGFHFESITNLSIIFSQKFSDL